MLNYAMKFLLKTLTVFLFLLSTVPQIYAASIESEGTPIRKLQRGFVNIALSPIEISNQWAKVANKEAAIPTWFTAGGTGILFMVGRALTGVYEMVTFPIPVPANYKPLVYPEFPWQELPEENSQSSKKN